MCGNFLSVPHLTQSTFFNHLSPPFLVTVRQLYLFTRLRRMRGALFFLPSPRAILPILRCVTLVTNHHYRITGVFAARFAFVRSHTINLLKSPQGDARYPFSIRSVTLSALIRSPRKYDNYRPVKITRFIPARIRSFESVSLSLSLSLSRALCPSFSTINPTPKEELSRVETFSGRSRESDRAS